MASRLTRRLHKRIDAYVAQAVAKGICVDPVLFREHVQRHVERGMLKL